MKITRYSLALALLFLSLCVLGQPGDPGGGGNPTVPISGIEFLIGGGVALALRRFLGGKHFRKK